MTTTDTAETAVDRRRAGYITGLRQLADLLEKHDDLPLPYDGTGNDLLWIAGLYDDHRAIAQTFARVIPGTVRKQVRDTAFDLKGHIGTIPVQLIVDRDEVCERVVTGVETVTEQVPDPDALAAVPTVEVTREAETVEWRCLPLLATGQVPA